MNFYRVLNLKLSQMQKATRNDGLIHDIGPTQSKRVKRYHSTDDLDHDADQNQFIVAGNDDGGQLSMVEGNWQDNYDNDVYFYDNDDDCVANNADSQTRKHEESDVRDMYWYDESGSSDGEEEADDSEDVEEEKAEYQYEAIYRDFNISKYVVAELQKRYMMNNNKANNNAAMFHPDNKRCELTTSQAHTLIQNYIATEALKYSSINNLLGLLETLLPGANLPPKLKLAFDSFSFDEDSQCIFKFHCCPCGKTVYVGENSRAENCVDPKCVYKSRFTEDTRKRTPLRELNYRSLSLLICELLHTQFFLKAILCKNSNSTEGLLLDIVDGDVAKRHKEEMRVRFNEEKMKRHAKAANVVEISLLFSIYYDGAQVFKKSTTSIWPLMLSILNLPPPLRKARGKGLFMLSLFTAKSGSNCEAFIMENLVNELAYLYNGFTIAIDGTVYIIQARLIMHCYDSRALESVVKVQGSGSYAGCPLCGLCKG